MEQVHKMPNLTLHWELIHLGLACVRACVRREERGSVMAQKKKKDVGGGKNQFKVYSLHPIGKRPSIWGSYN